MERGNYSRKISSSRDLTEFKTFLLTFRDALSVTARHYYRRITNIYHFIDARCCRRYIRYFLVPSYAKILTYLKIRKKNTRPNNSYESSRNLSLTFAPLGMRTSVERVAANTHRSVRSCNCRVRSCCYLAGVSGASLVAAVSHSVSD